MIVELTRAEINHLLALIQVNRSDGWYVGNKDRYWKRADAIEHKLDNAYADAPSRIDYKAAAKDMARDMYGGSDD